MGGKRKNSGNFSKADESGAKKSDDCDSQEELDGPEGSTLKWNATNNGVRYSARVMEKQEKLRRESSPAKQVVTDSSGQVIVSSVSPTSLGKCGGKTDESCSHISCEQNNSCFSNCVGSTSTAQSTGTVSSSGVGGLEETQRKKRNWELWSQDDKQLFFEALNDYGKDFDAIQTHLASKLRPKNKLGHCANPVTAGGNLFIPKNKDQVRHFYYRTWNKISKFLTFPTNMKKAFQELYGLVNYGELRKKQRVLNMKTAAKLSELIEKGTTTIKVRGKTFRIKTPVCRALKRLNRIDDVEHARVPCKLSLELNALDGKAWAAVQGVSHNPRVRVFVPLQRTLASVITYFEERWKSPSNRLKEQLFHSFGRRNVPRLRFLPTERRDMNLPIFRLSEATSSAKLSLKSFAEKILKEGDKAIDSTNKSKKKQGPSNAEDSVTEAEMSDFDPMDAVTSTTVFKRLKNSSIEKVESDPGHLIDRTLLSPDGSKFTPNEGIADEKVPQSKESPGISEICGCPPSQAKGEEDFLSHVWNDETIKKGWTAEGAGTMTCGELYLLLGQNDNLCFEYYWDTGEETSVVKSEGIKLIDRLVEVARVLKKRKTLPRSKMPWPVACSNCGYKYESSTNSLRSSPINAQGNARQSAKLEQMNRVPCGDFPMQSIPNPSAQPHYKKPAESAQETEARKVVRNEDTERTVFRQPKPVNPKEVTIPPPKPFLDLPKGNRRIGRPVLNRVVVPRVLPLTPKVPEAGVYSLPFNTHTAVRSTSIGNVPGGGQTLGLLKTVESQQLTRITELTTPSSTPAHSSSATLRNTRPEPDSCISVGSNEFQDLIQLGQRAELTLSNDPTDPESNFSFSSFMDMSLPESSKMAASVCLNSKEFLEETVEQSSSCSLGLSDFLTDSCSMQKVDSQSSMLCTPQKEISGFTQHGFSHGRAPCLPESPWLSTNTTNTNDPSELSLGTLLGSFDTAVRDNTPVPAFPQQNDVNFQSIIGEGSPNFLAKYSEQTSKLSTNNSKQEEM